MSGLDADGGVDQLVREDRGDLRRHGAGRMGQVRPMKISKWPSALRRLSQHSPIARLRRPALVKPMATRTRSGRGGAQRLEQRRHARRHPVQPALPIVVDHLNVSLSSPQGDGLGHRPCRRGEQPGARGAAGIRRGGAGAGAAEPRPGGLPLRGRGGGAPLSPQNEDLRRRRRRPHAGHKPARASDRRPTGTRRHRRLGRSAAEIERGPLGDAPIAFRS